MIKYLKKLNYLKKQKIQREIMERILSVADFSRVNNKNPLKVESIIFILPQMRAYSGGHTSVLRLGTALAKKGYDVKYTSFIDQSVKDMEYNASINLEKYQGKIIDKNEMFNSNFDIVVATSWDSVYYVKKMKGYKMYFVQDYEPYFHMYGELFLLAKKTYELGLHMVSLGEWNKNMIEKNCNVYSKIDCITFPYNETEYYPQSRNYENYKNKKEFILVVYIKDTGKRAPYILQHLIVNVKEKLLKEGINLKVFYYGESKSFICKGGENLGKLSKNKLLQLYNEADFGMVASLSNISLVTYEMLATGLPIIEFEDGTFTHFFTNDSAILTSFDGNELYNKIKYYIMNPSELVRISNNANNHLSRLSWDNTCDEFENILKKLCRSEEV